jgi:hypothetical protein
MSIKRILVTTLSAMAPLTPLASPAAASPAPALPSATSFVVDDDRAQCSSASFTSIAEAVDADGTLGNTWTNNLCVTDSPAGAMCIWS